MKWKTTVVHIFKNIWGFNKEGLKNAKRYSSNTNVEKAWQGRNERTPKQKDYVLSLDEALYLSKEMGIKTVTELQRIIMRSPPFSADTSPFVIENFFGNAKTDKKTEEILNVEKNIRAIENEKIEKKEIEEDEIEDTIDSDSNTNNDVVSKILVNNFNRNKIRTFIHDGKEWLEESEGIGTNKRSCAYVYIKRGSGVIKINNEEDFYIRWPYFYNRIDVIEPFHLTNTSCVYDVFIKLKGGGISGQAKAARLAIGRALLNACPAVHSILLDNDILYEDLRQKLPKMPGRRKCRAMKQWSKR